MRISPDAVKAGDILVRRYGLPVALTHARAMTKYGPPETWPEPEEIYRYLTAWAERELGSGQQGSCAPR